MKKEHQYNTILLTLAAFLTLPIPNLTYDSESKATHLEMFKNETYVEIVNQESLKSYLNTSTPILITFTSKRCESCYANDYQLVILADNYVKKNKKFKFAAICIEEHSPIIKELDIHAIPEVRLYYKGMYQIYDHGNDFTLLDRWIEGHLNFGDIHFIKSTKKFWKIVGNHQHALIWYGEDLRNKNHVFKDFIRCIFFKFSHHFFILASDDKDLGKELNLEWDNLYEYNRFDSKFRKVETHHLWKEKKNLDMSLFHRTAEFITKNSFRDVTLWNVDWLQTHHRTDMLIFYYKSLSENHKNFEGMDEKEMNDMRIYNETCKERLMGNVHCLIVDHENARVELLDNIYHVPFASLPETALVLVKYFRNRREIFLHNINESKTLVREELLEFVDKGMNGEILQFFTKVEEVPQNNKNRRIKVVNSIMIHDWLHDFSKDSFILVHDGLEAQDTRAMIYKFEQALKYIYDHLTKEDQIKLESEVNFGLLDCEKNDCFYYSDVGGHPSAAYFKPWEYTGVASKSYQDYGSIGEIVMLFFFNYKGSVEIKEWFRTPQGELVGDDKVRDVDRKSVV